VTNRLKGNFPGGVVDLRYRFVLAEGLISELDIARAMAVYIDSSDVRVPVQILRPSPIEACASRASRRRALPVPRRRSRHA
jgi:hypothetical protein